MFVKLAQTRRDFTKGRFLVKAADRLISRLNFRTAAFRISENAPGEFVAS